MDIVIYCFIAFVVWILYFSFLALKTSFVEEAVGGNEGILFASVLCAILAAAWFITLPFAVIILALYHVGKFIVTINKALKATNKYKLGDD